MWPVAVRGCREAVRREAVGHSVLPNALFPRHSYRTSKCWMNFLSKVVEEPTGSVWVLKAGYS